LAAWKYSYIIAAPWKLLPESMEIVLYYHGTLGIITRPPENIPGLSWKPGKYPTNF
jgi:hypothetical protein